MANPLASLEGLIPVIRSEGRLGPTFPDTELTVGDEWSNEQTLDLLGEEVGYTTANQIAGVEDSLVVIDSTTTVSAFDISLTDMLAELFGAAAGQRPRSRGGARATGVHRERRPGRPGDHEPVRPRAGADHRVGERRAPSPPPSSSGSPTRAGPRWSGSTPMPRSPASYEVTLAEPGESPASTTAGS